MKHVFGALKGFGLNNLIWWIFGWKFVWFLWFCYKNVKNIWFSFKTNQWNQNSTTLIFKMIHKITVNLQQKTNPIKQNLIKLNHILLNSNNEDSLFISSNIFHQNSCSNFLISTFQTKNGCSFHFSIFCAHKFLLVFASPIACFKLDCQFSDLLAASQASEQFASQQPNVNQMRKFLQ